MINRRVFGLLASAAVTMPHRALADVPQPLTPDDLLWQEGRYLPAYLAALEAAAGGDHGALDNGSQIAALVGDEASAVAMASRMTPGRQTPVDMNGATAEDALEAICARAAGARVVILNEAHHSSAHRAFAAEVMRALRPLGFNVLAAEAFSPPSRVTAFTVRKFQSGAPFGSQFGYYTLDPVFAELAREASALGYRLTDYEQRWDQRAPADSSWETDIAARETAQAENFVTNVLEANPNARALVLCGYNHVLEQPGLGGLWFAGQLKQRTGLDPLTIEQSDNWPRDRADQDPWHVRAVTERFNPRTPLSVLTSSGEPLTSSTFRGKVDLSIFHPRLGRIDGRPAWLAGSGERRPMQVDFSPEPAIQIIQAVRVSEGWGSVPADQLPVPPGEVSATLWLPVGDYVIRQERSDGARLLGKLSVVAEA